MTGVKRGYYADYNGYDLVKVIENPVGKGLSEAAPLTPMGEINYITGIPKLEQSYRDILSTPLGSRFMFPTYGSRLFTILGEANDYVLEDIAELLVKEDLERWETRGIIDYVEAKVSVDNKSVLLIKIVYRVKNSNDKESFIFSVNREIPEMK